MSNVRFQLHNHSEYLAFFQSHFPCETILATRDLGGSYNLNQLIHTERGAYVVRLYHGWMTESRLAQLQGVKQALFNADIPLPLAVASCQGETIFHYQGRLLEVEKFITHDGYADTWRRYAQVFTVLGQLHAKLARIGTTCLVEETIVGNYETPDVLLAWLREAQQELLGVRAPQNERLARQSSLVCNEAIRLMAMLQTHWHEVQEQLPRQLTHGDYGRKNVLFADSEVVAVLDFDFLRVRERVYELAYTLYWWLWYQGDGHIGDVQQWYHVIALLEAYNAANPQPLTHAELQALPLVMARVPLYWLAESRHLPNIALNISRHTAKIKDAQWIIAHQRELQTLFSTVSALARS